jgi:hypothetical protein
MAIKLKPNMGIADRLFRGALGVFMLLNGIRAGGKLPWKAPEILLGSLFVVYGVTGVDPLLRRLNLSTIPRASNNLFSLVKQAAPGQGINPMLTQQPVPGQNLRTKVLGQTYREVSVIQ